MSKNKEIVARDTSEIIGKEWYDVLIQDCQAIITEASEVSRWSLVEGYHELGTRILEEKERFAKAGVEDEGGIVKFVSQSLDKSTRTIYKAIQFATMFKDPEEVPGGKGVTWGKVCNRVLVGKSVEKECAHKETRTIVVCADCGKRVKE